MPGRVEGLWSKRAHRGRMDQLREATLVAGKGMAGSVDRSRRRQVTLLAREAWNEAVSTIAEDPGPAARRANILISGIELPYMRGRILRIGACRLAIGGELTPCERMDEASPGLRQALQENWRGGVFAQVLDGGTIRIGDSVEWETSSS